jgi:hypothetical protein
MRLTLSGIRAELAADTRLFKAPVLAKEILKYGLEKGLAELALDRDQTVSSRALWVLGYCDEMEPQRIKPFHARLIPNLKHKNLHPGVIRNTLRFFQEHPVPKKYESFMLDLCYAFLKNPSEAIAVRAFSVTVIFNISKPYPELLQELLMVLNELSVHEDGAAMRARIKNTIKAIHKSMKEKIHEIH